MSAFFSFKAVLKKERKKTYSTNTDTIIEVGVFGVVNITSDNSFYIIVNGKEYPIHSKSYSCKGKSRVYYQILDRRLQRIVWIRLDNKQELYRYNFLPFFVGVIAKGNLIQDKYTKKVYFDIKKTISNLENIEYLDSTVALSKEVMNNFRLRYKEYKRLRLELIHKDLNGIE